MLAGAGYAACPGSLPRPSARCRTAGGGALWGEIEQVYRQLGGVLALCPVQPGAWDVELAGIAVELDEEQHFNRYRALTLGSPLYEGTRLPVREYSLFCTSYEGECLRKASNRGYWASLSTIAQFGQAGALRDLNPPGAPRWKQRAFYDFLKDMAPTLTETPVARIAIWDDVEVDGARMQVKQVLDRQVKPALPALIALIERRSGVMP
jgi:hypothetical protein